MTNKTQDVETVEVNEEQPAPKEKMRIAITGDTYLSVAMDAAFDPKTAEIARFKPEDTVQLNEFRPSVVFICDDIELLKNDSLDDAGIIAAVQNVAQNTSAGVCIKTTLNTETMDRIAAVVGYDWLNAKVVYSPEFSEDPIEILTADINYVGGKEKAVDAFLDIIKHCTHTSAQEIVKGTLHEVIYAKLAVAGFKAVKQTFFNQMNQVIVDLTGANPSIVRRMIERSPELTDRRSMIPTYVKAKTKEGVSLKKVRSYMGEYANKDVKMLVGQTDRLTILEEAVNLRNLKED